tara:strand:- start:666 stop:1400 length:735 start_codon:yes stop_codon:yes gene_type:complete
MITNILIIGGTNQGNILARELHKKNKKYVISYAGRVNIIQSNGLNNRIGGFGGTIKMSQWLKDNKISHVVDASHPFAEQISYNTFNACAYNNIPIVRYSREPWVQTQKDSWQNTNSYEEASKLLNTNSRRIFLAIGRLNLPTFNCFNQHFYLLRMVEKFTVNPDFSNYHCLVSRGPFNVNDDISLIKKFKIDLIISKNAGGSGAFSKIQAARILKIPVIMIKRPELPNVQEYYNLEEIIKWLNN